MADLIFHMEVTSDRLHYTVNHLRPRFNMAGVDTHDLNAIAEIAAWADDELPGLRRRLRLAIAADAQRPQALHGTPVQIEEPTMTMAQATELGRDLATRLGAADLCDDPAAFEALAAEVAANSGDPDVMAALFEDLGAQGLLDVMSRAATFDQLQQSGAVGDGGAGVVLLGGLKSGLASATTVWSEQVCADFAESLVDVATTQPTLGDGGFGWPADALSYLLVDSSYSNEFLGSVAEQIDAHERAPRLLLEPVWSEPSGFGRNPWWELLPEDVRDVTLLVPPGTQRAASDPTVALMLALGRNPQVALDFFNPGGTDRSVAEERAQYYITDRYWADGDNALGEALDAAATGFHTGGAPVELQERSAWVASATIAYLAAREDEGGGRIGDAANDSLAHLLSAYITDVDAVAYGADAEGVVGSYVVDPGSSWLVGLPVGAEFSVGTLNAVLGEVLLDDAAMGAVAQAASAWNAARVDSAVTEWNAAPDGPTTVAGAVLRSSQLLGYLMGNLEGAAVADGAAADEETLARAGLFVGAASAVVGMIPYVGSVAQFVVEEAIVPPEVTGEDRAQTQMNWLQDRAREDLEFAVALAMADSPYLQREELAGAFVNENNETYAWFTPDGVDPTVLSDTHTRDTFRDWITGDAGDEMVDLMTDSSTAFRDGVERSVL